MNKNERRRIEERRREGIWNIKGRRYGGNGMEGIWKREKGGKDRIIANMKEGLRKGKN